MKVVEPSYRILDAFSYLKAIPRKLEMAGRVSHLSLGLSTDAFIRDRIKQGHFSILEHEKVSVYLICSRDLTHELVRHRIASYTQESTRYCDYYKEITVIRPFLLETSSPGYAAWVERMTMIEEWYRQMRDEGCPPEWARMLLPNCLKTEIVVTFNIREWLHVFKLRCDKKAHPQMRQLMLPLLRQFIQLMPSIFGHFTFSNMNFPEPALWKPIHCIYHATSPYCL
jgi:thymidylate synthase (FAD)